MPDQITRPMGVPVDPGIAAAQAAYDAALETETLAAMERHHIDRHSAWWIAQGSVEVKVAARYLEKATAGAWIAAFWRNLTPVED